MHGDVYEWTWDKHGAYPTFEVMDPTGPKWGFSHIVRGGSWRSEAAACRAAYRNWNKVFVISDVSDYVGARLVLRPL